MIITSDYAKNFYIKYQLVRNLGIELLNPNYKNTDINISLRIKEDYFKDLFNDLLICNGAIPVNVYRFILFVYASFLNDKYMSEIMDLLKDQKKYKLWVAMIYFRKNKDVKDLPQKEYIKLLYDCPENLGYIESIEWRLRINIKDKNTSKYIKNYNSTAFNNKKQEYNLNKMFTDEYKIQKEIMQKYENEFSRLRRIKVFMSDINKTISFSNKNLFEIISK